MLNKKGIVTLNMYSLLVIVYILLFLSTFWYYSDSKESISDKILEGENINSAISLRSELIDLASRNASSLEYEAKHDSEGIFFKLNGSTITAYQYGEKSKIENNISMLGIDFCSNYTSHPTQPTIYYFNGSCISIITS